MKIRLLQLVSLIFITMLSMSVYAGGAGCKSKDGHSKDMSAETMQEFKDSHSWMFSESGDADAKIPGHESIDKSLETGKAPAKDLVEI